jgi:phospholipase/carboxylesterase
MSADLGFVHRYVPGEDESSPTLLLLHGTGGNEEDLVPLGETLAPGAAFLSPRGKVSEYGAPRFFRRLAEGIFDHEDLLFRTHELVEFMQAASKEYGFDPSKVAAVGYSNGANVAASTILLHPGLLRAAVLFRAMVPFEPDLAPDLSGMPIFLAAGRMDRMIPPDNTQRLAAILTEAGADVDLRWRDTGHPLTYADVAGAKAWLSEVLPRLAGPQDDRE